MYFTDGTRAPPNERSVKKNNEKTTKYTISDFSPTIF